MSWAHRHKKTKRPKRFSEIGKYRKLAAERSARIRKELFAEIPYMSPRELRNLIADGTRRRRGSSGVKLDALARRAKRELLLRKLS